MTDNVKRPHRTSMEGMIWNANHVLELALRPGIEGIPKDLFEASAGICVMSTISVGLIFSGAVGTGIFTTRYPDGSWSNPVACGLTGIGFGLLAGFEAQDLIMFLPDTDAVRTFCSSGVKLSGKMDLTLGARRAAQGERHGNTSGFAKTLTVGFSKGVWADMDIEGAIVAPRARVNKHFYGQKVDPKDIIESSNVTFPKTKITLWPDVQAKLAKLAKGVQEEPTEQDKEKVVSAAAAANVAAESFHETKEEDIVDAEAAAAAKEKLVQRETVRKKDPPGEKHQRVDSRYMPQAEVMAVALARNKDPTGVKKESLTETEELPIAIPNEEASIKTEYLDEETFNKEEQQVDILTEQASTGTSIKEAPIDADADAASSDAVNEEVCATAVLNGETASDMQKKVVPTITEDSEEAPEGAQEAVTTEAEAPTGTFYDKEAPAEKASFEAQQEEVLMEAPEAPVMTEKNKEESIKETPIDADAAPSDAIKEVSATAVFHEDMASNESKEAVRTMVKEAHTEAQQKAITKAESDTEITSEKASVEALTEAPKEAQKTEGSARTQQHPVLEQKEE